MIKVEEYSGEYRVPLHPTSFSVSSEIPDIIEAARKAGFHHLSVIARYSRYGVASNDNPDSREVICLSGTSPAGVERMCARWHRAIFNDLGEYYLVSPVPITNEVLMAFVMLMSDTRVLGA